MSTAHAAQTATNPLVLQTMLPELTAYGRGLSHPATAASQSREHGLTTTADCTARRNFRIWDLIRTPHGNWHLIRKIFRIWHRSRKFFCVWVFLFLSLQFLSFLFSFHAKGGRREKQKGKIGTLVLQLCSKGQFGPSTFVFRSNLSLSWCNAP